MWTTRRSPVPRRWFPVLSRRSRRLVLPGVCATLALIILAPLLGRGFVLNYDMVFAPRQSLLPDSLGLGSALPRSVPADAVVALLTNLVAGDILQQAILLLALFAGPLGAGLLVPTESLAVRVVAAVSYGWSAYLAERLFIGHWPYLLAYACLPWIARAGLALRRGEPKSTVRLVLACAPAVLTPSGGLIATALAMVCAGPRRLPVTAGIAVVLNAPWWLPALLHPAGSLSTSDGVAAFAARAESWGGPVTSLLGLGGIWNAEVTPDSRANPLVPLLIFATVAVALLGLRELARQWGAPARAVTLLGVGGVLLAALGSLPGGAGVLSWTVEHLPGGGLLRDSQKWVAWWALPLALGFALGAQAAARTLRTRAAKAALLVAAAVFPVAMLPDLALAGWGRLESVDYPADWARVRAVLHDDERPGDVVTLPLSAFRQFAWNGNRTQLDPAPRVLPRTTVIDDTLLVSGRAIAGEDRRAAAVREADRDDLARLGIGWVLVEHGTPGEVDRALLDRLHKTYDGRWLSLYRVPGEIGPTGQGGPPAAPVVVADVGALALILLSLLWLALPAGRLTILDRRHRE